MRSFGPRRSASQISTPAAGGVLVVAACAVVGCGHGLRGPAEGGPTWREVNSAHFTVTTDLPQADAAAVVRELEALRAGLHEAIRPQPSEAPGRLSLAVVADESELEALAPPDAGGFEARFGGPLDGLFVAPQGGMFVIARVGEHGEPWRAAVVRAMTRQVLVHHLARHPPWLAEALAQYFETARVDARGTTVTLGEPNTRRRAFDPEWLVPVGDVFAWAGVPGVGADAAREERIAATAWLLLHYLVNHEPSALSTMLKDLARGSEPAPAVAAALATGDMTDFDRALREYAQYRKFDVDSVSVAVDDRAIGGRELSGSQSHAFLARLFFAAPGTAVGAAPGAAGGREAMLRRAASELDTAKRLAADEPEVLLAEAIVRPERRLAAAQRLCAIAPQDWRGFFLLAAALPESAGDDRVKALSAALERAPGNATVEAGLARELAARGFGSDALRYSSAAYYRAPTDPAVLDVHAGVLAKIDQCQAAIALARRAVEIADPRADGGQIGRTLAAHLDELTRSCRPGVVAPVSP